MKKCLACGKPYPSTEMRCADCGRAVRKEGRIDFYISELAEPQDGFKGSYFAELAALENGHFWFRARNRLILGALRKHGTAVRSFLEVGCGTGYILSAIAQAYPAARLCGSDAFAEGLAFASARLPGMDFMRFDARQIPFIDEFDAVGLFDVLEHIREDEQVLEQIRQALKPGGLALLTVPQHTWLWSQTDRYCCHERRYSARDLHHKIRKAGFEILRSTSFVFSLLPVVLMARFLGSRKAFDASRAMEELKISRIFNGLFERLLNTEAALIQAGFDFPAGTSRLVVARKPA